MLACASSGVWRVSGWLIRWSAKQYRDANNMTDALAALFAAAVAGAVAPCRDTLMREYDDKWHVTAL